MHLRAAEDGLPDNLNSANCPTKTPSTAENQSNKNNISFTSHNNNLADLEANITNFEGNKDENNVELIEFNAL